MAEETPQGYTGVTADVPQQVPQTVTADETLQHSGDAIAGAAPLPPAAASSPPAVNTIYIYAAVAAILGIVVGVTVALIALGPGARSSPYDLGTVISNADGLTGHLVLNWNQKLGYRLVVEPSDPVHLAGFSQTVNNAPRPLSVDIQLKDSHGSVLCGKTVLLKFDPEQAAALAASDGKSQAGTAAAGDQPTKAAQALDLAHSEAQELTREHDQDVFQNDLGRDGQTDSITAQGEMPCPRQVFDRTASWSFTPNFLTMNEQAELQNHLSGADENAPSAQDLASGKSPATRRKSKRKPPVAPTAYAIEGDDELVAFDFSKGMMETRGRKFFAMDKLSVGNNLAAWQDVPANIHYKCDLNSVCIIKRAGAGVLYARLRR
ncbi:MAG TPA: hypothetical protein VMQ56_10230 [Terracidiphilus sp.]|jgi:hypothetical protein|nr:hypothetical protein [Terracidiphilus sp.]